MPFIPFSFLIVLARNYSTILNRNDGSRYPCLVTGLRAGVSRVLLKGLTVNILDSVGHRSLLQLFNSAIVP